MSTPVELDEYAQQEFCAWVTAKKAVAEHEAVREKARSFLMDYLETHGADMGVVDGEPRVKLIMYDVSSIDDTRLREDEPFLARRYLRIRTDRRLKQMGDPS